MYCPSNTTYQSLYIDSSTLNTRGIPSARFIEDVSSYVTSSNIPLDSLTKQLHTLYGKYKFMESQLVTQQRNLHNKIPEIESALTALNYIQSSPNSIDVNFELSDSIYASATIQQQNTVMLWLGANVMLEYTYNDANTLLTKNLSNAKLSLQSLESDIEFLKDQITISEVNIARLHNYGIALKQSVTLNKSNNQQSQKSIQSSSTTTSSSSNNNNTATQGTIKADGKPVQSGRSFAQAAA